MRATRKIYYDDPDQFSCIAKIISISEDGIELDQTVAYPEGGGQEGDHGVITLSNNSEIKLHFANTRLSMPSFLYVDNFPNCKINGIILHKISSESAQYLSELNIGDEVTVNIDSMRRLKLSKGHTATILCIWQLTR